MMALTANTVFDIVGQTQTIIFSQSGSQVDEISYTGGQIVYEISTTYSLVKSEFALYIQYLRTYYNLLLVNFPSLGSGFNTAWPQSVFSITESGTPNRLVYNQTSTSNTVININYLPVATEATFATRSSPVTISIQEFFSGVDFLTQFATQVGLN